MALNTKSIKRKIKSVQNTKKITKTMEMISAAKMRKSTDAVLGTRLYARIASNLLAKASSLENVQYSLLENRKVNRVLLVILSSNRGLCGSFNNNILKLTESYYKENFEGSDLEVEVLAIGKKSAKFAKRRNLKLVGLFDHINDLPKYEDALTIAKMVIDGYSNNENRYDQVNLVYTDYYSAMIQKATQRKILPFNKELFTRITNDLPEDVEENEYQDFSLKDYKFEPDTNTVISYIIPRLIEIQIYQALLESSASEHSARMLSMKNASEAAKEMIKSLTLEYNKARQAAITTEISEITSGAEALNG